MTLSDAKAANGEQVVTHSECHDKDPDDHDHYDHNDDEDDSDHDWNRPEECRIAQS